MTPENGEILSAFADGEMVDPARLETALRDSEAVVLLETCARLRAEIAGDTTRPSQAFYNRMQTVLEPRGLRRLLARRGASISWPIAAGVAVATLVAGLVTGLRLNVQPGPAAPSAVTAVAPAAPGPAAPVKPAEPTAIAKAPEAGLQSPPGMAPPRPTHVLRFGRPGEWREGL
jgi:hypothetical protein